MKKIILSLVFVFAFVVVTPTSAENTLQSNKDVVAIDCVELAFAVDDMMGGISFKLFTAIVTSCEAQQVQP